ncbi:phage holin [Bifidobacterium dentium]|uniref:phage holin n=1 Tax=Bifidobacterium dentium TaxID=1689 RepID=UPI00205885A7|nr:MAG TPA: holin [Caudoviricetes sp.]
MEDKTDETPVTEKEMEDPSAGQRPDAKSYLLSDKAYDVLKWLALIALPALAWFISILGPTWSLPYVDAIVTTLNAVGTLIGILIGASTLKSKMTFTV